MTTRPEDRGPRMPSGPEEVRSAYGEPQSAYGEPQRRRRSGRQRESLGEAAIKSFIRSVGASLGRAIMRAILGRRR
jgi:Bacterial protein of unknown function (DUF853)